MFNIIKKTIIEFSDIGEENITDQTSFIEDLNLNSYDIANFIGRIEEIFDLEIPDRDLRRLQTVGELVEYLKEKAK